MSLSEENSAYIRQINESLLILDANMQTLSESIKEISREGMALQNAIVAYMSEKGIIDGPEDARLLRKLHMRSIAQLDQEIAHKEGHGDI